MDESRIGYKKMNHQWQQVEVVATSLAKQVKESTIVLCKLRKQATNAEKQEEQIHEEASKVGE